MLKFNKFTFILAFWLTLGSLNHVNAASQNLANSPSLSAENGRDSDKSLKVGTESQNSLDNQDPTCLISTFTYRGTYIQILSYSTYGYGPCDAKAFSSMTLPSIQASLATLEKKPYFIMKGGLMHTTATSVTIGLTAPYIEIGVLKFSIIAETILPLSTLVTSPNLLKQGFTATPYVEYPSIEKTYYFWAPGTEIYELVDKNGGTFVLTSYSSQFDRNATIQDLRKLPNVLSIPQGWSFRIRTLDKVLQVRARQLEGFTATRVMDEFGSFYIKR